MRIERFAPSPTGYLHLGHAFSALSAAQHAERFLLRIEDTDTVRCRPEYETAIFEDLTWLGLAWQTPVWRQSERSEHYWQAIEALAAQNLLYPCSCTRKEIAAACALPQHQPHAAPHGPDGIIYPGTCRMRRFEGHHAGEALRLNMRAAVALFGERLDLCYREIGLQSTTKLLSAVTLIHGIGDVVLWRKDTNAAAYHLAVVVDDAAQQISHVTRGADVAPATPLHRLLQALLGLPTPVYNHHRLITDTHGKRLAKTYGSKAIRTLAKAGYSRAELLSDIGF